MTPSYGNLQKYRNPNPIQRLLLSRFLERVHTLIAPLAPRSVLDAGCAEGFVVEYLREQGVDALFLGVDIDELAVRRGREISPQMHKGLASVTHLPFPDDAFDLVLSTEVLEHLPDPTQALGEIKRVAARYVVLSVPHEPWFRLLNFLRGKHPRQLGNDPEHLQNWSRRAFLRFVGSQLDVVTMRNAFPWLLLLARKEE